MVECGGGCGWWLGGWFVGVVCSEWVWWWWGWLVQVLGVGIGVVSGGCGGGCDG